VINVTKTFLPPVEDYLEQIKRIWNNNHLTNHGPLVNELENKIKEFLGVKYFFLVTNGTVALQIAIKALNLSGEIITTPFSYVATTSSIVWEGCKPVFVDIDPETLCLNPNQIEKAITKRTVAIMPVHVYGNPCEIDLIKKIASSYKLKVIYDAAHAFGVKVNGEQALSSFGDISTLSFHATKLFHCGEGGGIVTNSSEIAHNIESLRNFGHNGQEDFFGLGINGKVSELHAGMGLSVFPFINSLINKRKKLSQRYDLHLEQNINISKPKATFQFTNNYSYYPVILSSENELLKVREALNNINVFPRRYFYPSLDRLPYVEGNSEVPIARDISSRILCLPLYYDLTIEEVDFICDGINSSLKGSARKIANFSA
jgi:dTDP-4-amino-4,6-dideoxygalactose transaminase